MFKNNRTYFSQDITTEEAKKTLEEFEKSLLEENHKQAVKLYQKICRQMNERVKQNYLNPIKIFSKSMYSDVNKESYGFIVMGINCILIEFLYELQNGIDESSYLGRVKEAYCEVLPKLDHTITRELSEKFYQGIRCGIIHQGQTKEDTVITYGLNRIIEKNGKFYLCNPLTLFEKLNDEYRFYWKSVSETKYYEEKAMKLVKKYKLILSHIS